LILTHGLVRVLRVLDLDSVCVCGKINIVVGLTLENYECFILYVFIF